MVDVDPSEPRLLITCHTRGFACAPVEDTERPTDTLALPLAPVVQQRPLSRYEKAV